MLAKVYTKRVVKQKFKLRHFDFGIYSLCYTVPQAFPNIVPVHWKSIWLFLCWQSKEDSYIQREMAFYLHSWWEKQQQKSKTCLFKMHIFCCFLYFRYICDCHWITAFFYSQPSKPLWISLFTRRQKHLKITSLWKINSGT